MKKCIQKTNKEFFGDLCWPTWTIIKSWLPFIGFLLALVSILFISVLASVYISIEWIGVDPMRGSGFWTMLCGSIFIMWCFAYIATLIMNCRNKSAN